MLHGRVVWRLALIVLAAPLLLASPQLTAGQPTPPSTAGAAAPGAPVAAPAQLGQPASVAPAPPVAAVAPPAPVSAAPPPAAVSAAPPAAAANPPLAPASPPPAPVSAVPPVAVVAPPVATSAPAVAKTSIPVAVATTPPLSAPTALPASGTVLPAPTGRAPTVAPSVVATPAAVAINTSTVPAGLPSPAPTEVPGSLGTPAAPGSVASLPPVSATAGPSVAILGTVTGTPMTLLTVMPTPTATQTPIATPTQIPALALESIQPASALNDQPARLAITGAGFVDTTYLVRIGGRALTNVRVESGTTLTATLPAGVCPGTYGATLQDPAGREASGGDIAVQSVRTIVQGAQPTGLNIALTGLTQRRSVELPSMSLEDTECGQSDWRLLLTVEMPRDSARGKTLIPGTVSVRWDDGGTAKVKLSPPDGQDREQGLLVIPRNGATTLLVTPSLDLEVPASAYAGSYTTTLSATFAD